ncbi:ABC transporter permease [Colwellia sp. MB02u-14]|uniref:ABC transporter permease n=1 Tax=Colwellia sp. MB02u-14 TaxID=2759815 RepID=UPI0015F4B01D|nr:ABC transporter permease [Colwellia sp. MB02u-14]MBA6301807.1 ABC transporter permease [Colwellia sp. MB02u-14]
MNLFIYQLKQAFLGLKKKPAFVFSVVSTMGITLGALLCVVTLAYVMLLKPLPYPEQEQLFVVESKIKGSERAPKISMYPYPAFIELYKKQSALNKVAMIAYENTNITSHAEQPRINNAFISPEYFSLLNPPIALGRTFEASEALNTNNPVAVISFATWQTLYDQKVDVLEKNLTVNGVSFRIVGVSAETFIEPSLYQTGEKTQVWLPWDFNPVSEIKRKAWGNFAPNMFLLGKLDNTLTAKQAEMILTPQLTERWQQELVGNARFKEMTLKVEMKPLINVISGNNHTNLVLLFLAVVGLLVITVTNVSHLFVARSAEQQHQMAIKASLGMNRKQGAMQVFVETSCLMILAFFVALATANIGFFLLKTYLAELFNRIDELSISLTPLFILVITMLLITLILTKLTLKYFKFTSLNTTLQNSNKGQGVKVSTFFQQGVIMSQILVTVLIIFANMVLFKQAYESVNHETGFDIEQIEHLVLAFNGSGRPNVAEQQATYKQIKAQLLQIPQVSSVSLGNSPLSSYSVRKFGLGKDALEFSIEQKEIDEHYFSMIKQSLISGDYFTSSELNNNDNVVIINESLAKQLKQFGKVIGQQIKGSRDESLIVKGIVADIHLPNSERPEMNNNFLLYRPSKLGRGTGFMVKLKADQILPREQLVTIITRADARYSIYEYQSLTENYQQLLLNKKITLFTTGIITLVVIILAALGVFGVLDFNTQIRRFEIGTRLAIGAKGRDIIQLILKDNSKGIFIGVGLSMLVLLSVWGGFGESFQQYLNLQILPLFILTLALISLISFIACYLPLRQYINKPVIHALKGSQE